MLNFRVLGPLEIVSSTCTVRPGGSLQRTLLVTLLTSGGRLVPAETLIYELWPDDQPHRVENALQAHVSRLRQRLAALEPENGTSRVVTCPSGYQLHIDDEELDATVFIRTIEKIKSKYSGNPGDLGCHQAADLRGRPGAPQDDRKFTIKNRPVLAFDAATDEVRRALALWRGPTFGGTFGGQLCRAAKARYEESRLAALGFLFDCELRSGAHVKIISELSDLVREHPFQERFCQQLMTALYRSGRQAEALAVYRDLRRRLSEELGLEPSPTMRDHERAILEHAPMLDAPTLPNRWRTIKKLPALRG